MSRTAALWVSQPMEIRSTPVAATAGAVAGGDAAGCLGDGAAINDADGFAQHLRAHVVEQHRIHADLQRLTQLLERIDLEFDFYEMADGGAGAFECPADAAGDGDVVVLDQHRVIEAEAVV